jgi:hypothetical protein
LNKGQFKYKEEKRKTKEWGKHRGDRTAQSRRYRERHLVEVKAQSKLRRNITNGNIIKPTKCEQCDREVFDSIILHAHHDDYSKPLEVRWLCCDCHNMAHGKEKIKREWEVK